MPLINVLNSLTLKQVWSVKQNPEVKIPRFVNLRYDGPSIIPTLRRITPVAARGSQQYPRWRHYTVSYRNYIQY